MLRLGVVAYDLGYCFEVTTFVLVGVAGLLHYVREMLARARRNWFVGTRTPWTLSIEAVWDRTHALGSRLFELSALSTLGGLPFGEYAVYFLPVPALGTAAVTIVYPHVLYERLEGESASSPGG